MSKQPNVILICVDQWRGDCLSIDGHPVVHTPYLDQMALGGTRCSHAYSATPTCIPARAGLLTGQSQRTHGRVGYQDGVPWNYPVTIASEFTRQGYQTQAVGKMHVHPARSQMGFQNIILHNGYLHFMRNREHDLATSDDYLPWLRQRANADADYFDLGINCNSVVARPWDKPEELHPTNFVASQSIDFLRRRDPRKPFFLFMSFHRPHPPYDPPAWAFEQYVDAPMPEVPVGAWAESSSPFNPWRQDKHPSALSGKIDPRVLQRARAGYYGHMTHIDHQVNRFMEILQEYGEDKNTYVCFVSDHGEMMGDHHLYRKALPYEGSARVPLILQGPAGSGIKKNNVIDEVIELRDLMPTLLDCASLTIPDSVDGRSFLSLARGEGASDDGASDEGVRESNPAWRSYIHGEHVNFGQSVQWVTDGCEKFIWLSKEGQEQFFDLKADPQECQNLIDDAQAKARVDVWRQRLMDSLKGREEGFTDGTQLIPGREVNPCLSHILQDEVDGN